ncbi:Fc.00g038510.m01.CDS01 [Cosmosporella sp. VM-42]
MPSADVISTNKVASNIVGGNPAAKTRCLKPLLYSGSLEKFTCAGITPVIGREYEGLQVTELLEADNIMMKDLASTISSRGVVFRRDQVVTPDQMKQFCLRLTEVAGCLSLCFWACSLSRRFEPESSGLHVHLLTEEGSELDDQVSVISSEKEKKGGGLTHQLSDFSQFASAGWHTDISFESVPSDYAMLKIHTLPPNGGDTTFLEGLTATHDANFFHEEAKRLGNPLRKGVRGSPVNTGEDLKAVHPVIRTNPVPGWKSVYVNKGSTKRINGVTKDESDMLLNYLFNLVTQNHDAQVRFK